MKGWIRFGREELEQPKAREWHKAREVLVVTACDLTVKTDERPGNDYPGYGARVCAPCLAAPDADALGRVG